MAYTDNITGKDFVDFIRERAVLLRELLSERGSIYLHTDCKVGHYLKVMMDGVFGAGNFRNDITRVKCCPKNFHRKAYGNVKDMILFYSKADDPIWNEPMEDYPEEDKPKLFPKTDKDGRRYGTNSLHAPGESGNRSPFRGLVPPPGRHWANSVQLMEEWDGRGMLEWSDTGNPRLKKYLDESPGKRVQDIWTFKDPPHPSYPTEKNAQMLDRIVRTSSDPGSIVLDCFCGSGTTLKAAFDNGRRWIGIDSSDVAIEAARKKLGACGMEFVDMDRLG